MILHSQDVNVCGCLLPAAQSPYSVNLNISSSLPVGLLGKTVQFGFSRVIYQLGWTRGNLGILLILPDYLVDTALTDVPSLVHTTQENIGRFIVLFCLFFCSEVTVSFTLFFHYRLAYLFTFYCHLGIPLQTEWSPVFLEAHFPGSAMGNVLSRTRKGSKSGAVPRPQLSPLDSVSLSSPPIPCFPWGLLPF